MKIRELTQSDIEFMKDHSVSRGILKSQPEQIEFTYALEYEDKLLCIGGIRLINCASAWCWVDLSTEVRGHTKTVYQIIREWMGSLVKEKGLKRLQAYIEPDFPEAVRMIQHLGFEKESNLEKFLSNGRDAYLYKRIF